MALLFQPHRDRKEAFHNLIAQAGVLLGMMGWATAAMGLAVAHLPFFLAIPGGLIAMLQGRWFRATLVLELVGFAFVISLVAGPAAEWMFTAVAVSMVGRAIAMVVRARDLDAQIGQ